MLMSPVTPGANLPSSSLPAPASPPQPDRQSPSATLISPVPSPGSHPSPATSRPPATNTSVAAPATLPQNREDETRMSNQAAAISAPTASPSLPGAVSESCGAQENTPSGNLPRHGLAPNHQTLAPRVSGPSKTLWQQWRHKSVVLRTDADVTGSIVAMGRATLLQNACDHRDFFFLLLHQVFCRHFLDIGALERSSGHTDSFHALQLLLEDNTRVPPRIMERFVGFPESLEELGKAEWFDDTRNKELVRKCIVALESQMPLLQARIERGYYHERGFPPLAAEIHTEFQTSSPVFMTVLFTCACRSLYPDHCMQDLNLSFQNDMRMFFTSMEEDRLLSIRRYKAIRMKPSPLGRQPSMVPQQQNKQNKQQKQPPPPPPPPSALTHPGGPVVSAPSPVGNPSLPNGFFIPVSSQSPRSQSPPQNAAWLPTSQNPPRSPQVWQASPGQLQLPRGQAPPVHMQGQPRAAYDVPLPVSQYPNYRPANQAQMMQNPNALQPNQGQMVQGPNALQENQGQMIQTHSPQTPQVRQMVQDQQIHSTQQAQGVQDQQDVPHQNTPSPMYSAHPESVQGPQQQDKILTQQQVPPFCMQVNSTGHPQRPPLYGIQGHPQFMQFPLGRGRGRGRGSLQMSIPPSLQRPHPGTPVTPGTSGIPVTPHTPLLPPPNYRIPQTVNTQPMRLGLHQADIREPVKQLRHWNPQGQFAEVELYYYLCGYAVIPSFIDPAERRYSWKFMLSAIDIQSAPRFEDTKSGKSPIISIQPGCKVFRLRAISLKNSQKDNLYGMWPTANTCWPSVFYIFVNGKELFVRRKAHNGKDLPLDITRFLKEGKNELVVHFLLGPGECKDSRYVFGVESMAFSMSDQVRLQAKTLPASATYRKIRQRLNLLTDDDDLAVVSDFLTVSLVDPFMATIFDTPARSTSCNHLECFDIDTFIRTRKCRSGSTPLNDDWRCPICKADARPQNLVIDEYFVNVRAELQSSNRLSGAETIKIQADGSWTLKFDTPEKTSSIPVTLKRKADRPLSRSKTPAKQETSSPMNTTNTGEPIVIEID
ncbi:hypothetical protein N7532_003864 [Penicillium argentinense]|uniref:SP-RING-type domain-containing protein n=1 Tax=Penicillium argentinense TaxID=1131581 RepID=A0A9W9KEA4_9EURO|nr:uncharacterized protein N7532_003864 [Penicillium argentinense]KAJ5103335.1 hypothetical protein N7532_003864 [Penicillium argentinense]